MALGFGSSTAFDYRRNKSQGPVVCSSKEIHTNRWTYKGKTYVMAVNPTDKPVVCELGGFDGKENTVLFESRKLSPSGRKAKEVFKPLEAHLYVY